MQSCVGCVSLSRLSLTKGNKMEDYAQSLIDIKHLRNKAHAALSDKKWEEADAAIAEIVDKVQKVRAFCAKRREERAVEA